MKHLLVVRRTENAKVGPRCATTYRPVPETCPQTCPFLDSGCYIWKNWCAEKVGLSRSRNDSLDIAEAVEVIRHHVTGDVFLNDQLDVEYVQELFAWHHSHPNVRDWIYTHRIKDWNEAGLGPDSIPNNLVVFASVDSPDEAVEAHRLGWRTARVVRTGGLMPGEVWCPVDKLKAKGKLQNEIKVTCGTCGACWKDGKRHSVALRYIEGGRRRKRARKRAKPVLPRESPAIVEAASWLRCALAEKPLAYVEVKRLALASGHAMPTVLRAKRIAGVRSLRVGFGPRAEWYWKLTRS